MINKLCFLPAVFIAIVSLFTIPANAQQHKSSRPNIIVILSDDMGYSDIGSFGSEIPTPNLDQLAEKGLRFAQFYNHGRCCPTRASLLTGLNNHQTGVGNMVGEGKKLKDKDEIYGYSGQMNFDCVTMAEVLRGSGYHTYMAGKWHLGAKTPAHYPLQRGFDRFYGILAGATNYFRPEGNASIYAGNKKVTITDTNYYTSNAFTDNAIDFIKEQKDDKPFFLYLAYNAAHTPLLARNEDIEKVKGLYDKGWDTVRNNRVQKLKQLGLIEQDLEPAAASAPWSGLSKEKQENLRRQMTTYAAIIYNMDQNIGRLTDYLEKSGKKENTLIIYLSDNGATFRTDFWNMCNAPFTGHKRHTYEGGIATHAIVSWPKVITGLQGKITRSPADIIDIMPTVLEVAGATYPKMYKNNKIHPIEGHSLVPVFKTGTRKEPEWFYWEHDNNYGVRSGEWKAVKPNTKESWELYNIREDRGETKNIAARFPEQLNRITAAWQKWAVSHAVFPKPKPGAGSE